MILHSRRTNIDEEFQRIIDNVKKNDKNEERQNVKFKELLKGSVLKPLGISMGLMFFQQFTGVNAVVYYTVGIFQSAGSTIDKHYATIIIGFVQLICTATSGMLVIRKNLI